MGAEPRLGLGSIDNSYQKMNILRFGKQVLAMLAVSLIFVQLLACEKKDERESPGDDELIEVIGDLQFRKGFGLRDTLPGVGKIINIYYPVGRLEQSLFTWQLAQWSSRFNLITGTESKNNDTVSYVDPSKKVWFRPDKDNMEIGLELKTSKEFDRPRREGEFWPHLLLEQNFPKVYRLNEISEARFTIDTRLVYCRSFMDDEAFDPGLHTSMFVGYLVISNVNHDSEGYGECYYYGFQFFDYRHRDVPPYRAEDVGKPDATGNFIFIQAGKDLYSGSLHDKQWVKTDKDLLPFLKDAFAAAKASNFMRKTNFDDLGLVGMNIGLEVPGTFDTSVILKNMSLKVRKISE